MNRIIVGFLTVFRMLFPRSMKGNIKHWRKKGISIGKNCYIFSELPVGRDCFLLSIGDRVLISNHVTFLQHDASMCVATHSEFTDVLGKTTIGDDCFIGFGSIIMPGVSLANGTIVGAGSVVTKSVNKSDMIIAGNPARIICSKEDFLKKNLKYAVNLDGMNQSDIAKYLQENPDKIIHRASLD